MTSPNSDDVALLILAAGSSSRMRGCDKLVEPVYDKPLLCHVVDVAIETGNPVFVTLPSGPHQRRNLIENKLVKILDVPDVEDGMSSSFRAWATSSYSVGQDVMVLLADMPDITPEDLQKMLKAFVDSGREKIVRATNANQTPGHPVIFPHRLAKNFSALKADQGARAILAKEDVIYCILPNEHAITDLDTPEQWKNWRLANKGSK